MKVHKNLALSQLAGNTNDLFYNFGKVYLHCISDRRFKKKY